MCEASVGERGDEGEVGERGAGCGCGEVGREWWGGCLGCVCERGVWRVDVELEEMVVREWHRSGCAL